ncbi:hypothetical protein C8F04DRAFT_370444 [Mycena alexandri]|uniref:DUF8191 domain-containing protein n=1 Tax=Mycena alexandri TaxID=1745969 RepID=A0AAD6T480_9AGAR|nr:hypothetical protein C8F04DRAFT_370444 [Mycena alexandri]
MTKVATPQGVKLRKLERVIRDLLANELQTTQDALDSCGIRDFEAFLSSDEVSDPEAVWDELDGVYRCSVCMWEIEERMCPSGCGFEFDIDPLDDADFTSNEEFFDRVSAPRGDTPLRDLERYLLPSHMSPRDSDEYEQLRRRGATRLMCETFHLQFDPDTGIIAWADGDIYDEFSGPLMREGDFWKIMLGRRIQLDDDDPDGSGLIETLLEDALLFPLPNDCRWETVEESPGIWVTRKPGFAPHNKSSGDDSSPPMESLEAKEETQEEEADNMPTPGYVALAVQQHDYDTSDDDEENDDRTLEEEVEDKGYISDPSWAWDASVEDTEYYPGEEAEMQGEADSEEEVDELEEELDSDSADSDFNSEEMLSGDEQVIG